MRLRINHNPLQKEVCLTRVESITNSLPGPVMPAPWAQVWRFYNPDPLSCLLCLLFCQDVGKWPRCTLCRIELPAPGLPCCGRASWTVNQNNPFPEVASLWSQQKKNSYATTRRQGMDFTLQGDFLPEEDQDYRCYFAYFLSSMEVSGKSPRSNFIV